MHRPPPRTTPPDTPLPYTTLCRSLEGEDRAPVLHRAEELRLAGGGNVVELGKRVGDAEVVGVVFEQRPGGIEREARLLAAARSEEHTSELQSLMRISYAVFCLKKKTTHTQTQSTGELEIQIQ